MGHSAWVYDPDANFLFFMHHGHHDQLFMEIEKKYPDEVTEMLNTYEGNENSRLEMGDVEMGYKDDKFQPVISSFVTSPINLPVDLQRKVLELHNEGVAKHAATDYKMHMLDGEAMLAKYHPDHAEVDSRVHPNMWKFFRNIQNDVYVWRIQPNDDSPGLEYDGFPSHADAMEEVYGASPSDSV